LLERLGITADHLHHVAEKVSGWLYEASVLIMVFGMLDGFFQKEHDWQFKAAITGFSLASFCIAVIIDFRNGDL